eukprot:1190935-Prorocentrum_minimum.AAC.2
MFENLGKLRAERAEDVGNDQRLRPAHADGFVDAVAHHPERIRHPPLPARNLRVRLQVPTERGRATPSKPPLPSDGGLDDGGDELKPHQAVHVEHDAERLAVPERGRHLAAVRARGLRRHLVKAEDGVGLHEDQVHVGALAPARLGVNHVRVVQELVPLVLTHGQAAAAAGAQEGVVGEHLLQQVEVVPKHRLHLVHGGHVDPLACSRPPGDHLGEPSVGPVADQTVPVAREHLLDHRERVPIGLGLAVDLARRKDTLVEVPGKALAGPLGMAVLADAAELYGGHVVVHQRDADLLLHLDVDPHLPDLLRLIRLLVRHDPDADAHAGGGDVELAVVGAHEAGLGGAVRVLLDVQRVRGGLEVSVRERQVVRAVRGDHIVAAPDLPSQSCRTI